MFAFNTARPTTEDLFWPVTCMFSVQDWIENKARHSILELTQPCVREGAIR